MCFGQGLPLCELMIGGSNDGSEEVKVFRQGNTQSDLDLGDNNVTLL